MTGKWSRFGEDALFLVVQRFSVGADLYFRSLSVDENLGFVGYKLVPLGELLYFDQLTVACLVLQTFAYFRWERFKGDLFFHLDHGTVRIDKNIPGVPTDHQLSFVEDLPVLLLL